MMQKTSRDFLCRDNKAMSAYVVFPEVTAAPAVIILMEMYGITDWLRSFSDWVAQSGYIAVTPDMFHRVEPGLSVNCASEEEHNRLLAMYRGFDYPQGTDDLICLLQQVRNMPECTGKVGTLGFCFGGKLAYCMAARSSADCNIGFYPVGLEKQLTEPIKQPFLLCAALADPYITADAQAEVHRVLEKEKLATIHDYPDCGHAFMRTTCEFYNARQAEVARGRCLEYLNAHLKSAVGAKSC